MLELELIHTALHLHLHLFLLFFFCLSLCFCCCVITCCFSYNSQKKKKNSVDCLERQQDTIYDHTVIAHCTLQVKPSVIIVQHPTIKVMDKINTLYHYQLIGEFTKLWQHENKKKTHNQQTKTSKINHHLDYSSCYQHEGGIKTIHKTTPTLI